MDDRPSSPTSMRPLANQLYIQANQTNQNFQALLGWAFRMDIGVEIRMGLGVDIGVDIGGLEEVEKVKS